MLTAQDQNHNYLYLKRQSPSWQIISVGDERHERPEQRTVLSMCGQRRQLLVVLAPLAVRNGEKVKL